MVFVLIPSITSVESENFSELFSVEFVVLLMTLSIIDLALYHVRPLSRLRFRN